MRQYSTCEATAEILIKLNMLKVNYCLNLSEEVLEMYILAVLIKHIIISELALEETQIRFIVNYALHKSKFVL